MKNIFIILILFLNTAFSQVSLSDLNKLSNKELDIIKDELQNKSGNIIDNSGNDKIPIPVKVNLKNNKNIVDQSKFFGYDYLRRNISFFDNIPTPSDYKLGPGDEIIVSMWGETNSRKNMIIDKNGMVFYENIGFINLSNLTLESAELILLDELSRIYSTLKDKDNSTQLMLSLGKLKSMNIYFSGYIERPGINLIHPFSDIFSAIVQAGGINEKGSLREVQLIRNESIIANVDFYSFFMNGKNNFSNIKLVDGDVIHVTNKKNSISILGEVNRPAIYELLSKETLSDAIAYASGFSSQASTDLIITKIIPVENRLSDDNARTSITVNFNDKKLTTLNNGDVINVKPIPSVDSQVTIYGRVKSPGKYPGVNATLKDVLDIAGGFEDPIFRQSIRDDEIFVLRRDSENFYSKEIILSYEESNQFKIMPNDKIFVYEDVNYKTSLIYTVKGEVFKPGTYPLRVGLTLKEALDLAEGITELSTYENIILSQEFTEIDEFENETTILKPVADANLDFELGPNSVINVLPFENVVNVEGNVYNPGLVSFNRGLTMSQAIILAGGYKPYSMKKRAYIKRVNGKIEKANIFRGRAKRLQPGDTVFVPINPNPSEFSITEFVSDFSTVMANIAAILIIVDNQNN